MATLLAALALTAAAVLASSPLQRLRSARHGSRATRFLEVAETSPSPELCAELVRLAYSSDSAESCGALGVIARRPQAYGGAIAAVSALVRQGPGGPGLAASAALQALADAYPAAIPELLGDASPAVRVAGTLAAARCLARRERFSATDRYARMLVAALRDPAERVRLEACRGLRPLGPVGISPSLELARRDPSEAVRREAIAASASGGDPEAIAGLVQELAEDHAPLQQEVLEALATTPAPPILDWIARARSGPVAARVAHLRAIGTQASPALIDGLLTLLADPEKPVRREAARSIAAIERSVGKPAKDAVVEALSLRFDRETSRSVREALCDALAWAGTPAAARAVHERLEVPDDLIAERLREAATILENTPRGR